MTNSKDGDKVIAEAWEHSVHRALASRNRILGAMAVLALAATASWRVWNHYSGPIKPLVDETIAQDWSVDINRATSRELQLIPGLGPKLVQAILDRRQELGGFQSLEQLGDIPGIKQQRLRTLTRYLTISDPPSSEPTTAADE